MKYGLIGRRLPHSFSKEIHGMIGSYEYELRELEPEELESFFRERDFLGINVTIPYKEAVMRYLDDISGRAMRVGCVNTVVNRGGKLYGYNTDIDGLTGSIEILGADISGSKVLILGTGATSKTAFCAVSDMGAGEIIKVSRNPERNGQGTVSYEEAVTEHHDASLIINCTPCGMFPDNGSVPIDLEPFTSLLGVLDCVYNPLRTRLVQNARAFGIPAGGGMYMLAEQAVKASERFADTEYPSGLTEEIYKRVLREKENIVLTGMPGSGKTSVAEILGKRLGKKVFDTDLLIVEKAGMPVTEIFRIYGEKEFRNMETEVIEEVSKKTGVIISTGGGAVLRDGNVRMLKQNGRIIFLDREPGELVPTGTRPLADTSEKIMKLYEERLPVYRKAADETITAGRGATAADTAAEAERRLKL
ncbi:MAG: hypothetical protein IJT00_07720 [Lachnospiraceae bacterium]|nr:hypothetical protein [Lachnospiraceae bacterium]